MSNKVSEKGEKSGLVIWITGLSDSGKTTLANLLAERLRGNGKAITLLDGDQLREVFGANSNYDREARLDLGFKYSKLCKILAMQGNTVIIATIALFREIHSWNRANFPKYFEIYLKTPIEELRRRDSKGLYRRYDSGETSNVYGLDLKIDEPPNPEYTVKFDPAQPPSSLADDLISILLNHC